MSIFTFSFTIERIPSGARFSRANIFQPPCYKYTSETKRSRFTCEHCPAQRRHMALARMPLEHLTTKIPQVTNSLFQSTASPQTLRYSKILPERTGSPERNKEGFCAWSVELQCRAPPRLYKGLNSNTTPRIDSRRIDADALRFAVWISTGAWIIQIDIHDRFLINC